MNDPIRRYAPRRIAERLQTTENNLAGLVLGTLTRVAIPVAIVDVPLFASHLLTSWPMLCTGRDLWHHYGGPAHELPISVGADSSRWDRHPDNYQLRGSNVSGPPRWPACPNSSSCAFRSASCIFLVAEIGIIILMPSLQLLYRLFSVNRIQNYPRLWRD